jgi:hypothetical protein
MAYFQVFGFPDQFPEAIFRKSDNLPALIDTCGTATSVALSDPLQSSQQLAPSSSKRVGPRFTGSGYCTIQILRWSNPAYDLRNGGYRPSFG